PPLPPPTSPLFPYTTLFRSACPPAVNPTGTGGPGPPGASPLESTATLLARVRKGDVAARDRILARYRPALHRWAHGRLPSRARGDRKSTRLNSSHVSISYAV